MNLINGVIPYFIAFCLYSLMLFLLTKYKTISEMQKKMYSEKDVLMFLKHLTNFQIAMSSTKFELANDHEKKSLKVIFTEEGKAYWVDNNIFYVSKIINGHPDFDNAQKIDTNNMSKEELDKMLFILDNLNRRNDDERGGSGN
jgi:hypothetical protein